MDTWPADRRAATPLAEGDAMRSSSPACGRPSRHQSANSSSSSGVCLTGVSASVSLLLSLASQPAQHNQHIKQTQSGGVPPGDGGTGQGQREHVGTPGRGRVQGGGALFQSKQAQRSALKSNLILQLKDSTKLFSRKRREAQKSWR